jgi:hypothetical protein
MYPTSYNKINRRRFVAGSDMKRCFGGTVRVIEVSYIWREVTGKEL